MNINDYSKRELICLIEEHLKNLPYSLRPYYLAKYMACMNKVNNLYKLALQLEKRNS